MPLYDISSKMVWRMVAKFGIQTCVVQDHCGVLRR